MEYLRKKEGDEKYRLKAKTNSVLLVTSHSFLFVIIFVHSLFWLCDVKEASITFIFFSLTLFSCLKKHTQYKEGLLGGEVSSSRKKRDKKERRRP